MLSQNEIDSIIDALDVAFSQSQQELCGQLILRIKKHLRDQHGITIRMFLKLLSTGGSQPPGDNPNPPWELGGFDLGKKGQQEQPKPDNGETTTNDNTTDESVYYDDDDDDGDVTTIWVRPWAKRLLRDCKDLPFKDARHCRKMLERRFASPRTITDLEWLYDISHRNGQSVPKEFFVYMKGQQQAS